MPDRYWVGGSATWDGTPGTKWATTSGGTGGASIPGPNDDVFFDANSGAAVVSIGAINNGAKSINCTGFTGTIAGTGGLTVSGSITLSAGMTYTHTGVITIDATATLTTAGKTFSALTIGGAGITVTLGDALNTAARNIILTQGTFTTNNFAVTCAAFSSNNTNVRTINLGSSTLNINAFQAANSTNLTFNAGTSQINLTGAGSIINVGSSAGSGGTFHNVSFSAIGSGNRSISGSNTFNNLTIDNTDTNAIKTLVVGANQTVSGALTCAGSSIFRRVFLRSDIPGIARTITAASISANDCDFSSITIAGAAAGASPTRAGNCGGNSGITFPAAKTVYRVGGSTSWAGVNSWALSSGGAGADANFPLAQDTAIIDNSATTGITLQIETYNIGTLDASARTNAITLSHGLSANICGSYTLGAGVTISGAQEVAFIGPVTSTITTAGKTLTFPITILNTSCVFSLADAFNMGTFTLTLTAGTLTTNNFNVTAGFFNSANANSRTINLGSSTLTILGVNFGTTTNLTFNAGTSQINFTSVIATSFVGTGLTYHNVSFTATSTFTNGVSGSATFNNFTIAAPSATAGLRQITFDGNHTINGTLTCAGSSVTSRVFLTSDTNAVRTLTVAAISANDCDFRSITLAGAAAGAAPTRAGDCGGNSGITFPAAKTVYRVGTTTIWADANSWALSSGGTGLTDNFPLPQDTAVIDNATALAGTLSMVTAFNIGTLDMSARTTALTINHSADTSIVRAYTVGSGITITGTRIVTFTARSGFAELTSAGKTITFSPQISTFGASFRVLDALNCTNTVFLIAGTFDFNGFNVTAPEIITNNANQRTLALGSATLTLTGATAGTWGSAIATNLTVTGTGTISFTAASGKNLNGGTGVIFPCTINNGGAGVLTIIGSNTINTLSNTVQPTTFRFRSGDTTTITNWNVNGTAGNRVTINSINNANITTPPILSKSSGTVSADYLDITFSNATGGAGWYAGANSVDSGANSGWIFTVPPTPGPTFNAGNFFLIMGGW